MKKLLLSACLLWHSASVWANVLPHNLFSDNMVLQRGTEVPIWGWADVGEKVTVSFAGQSLTTSAVNGKWMVKLKPMKENATPQDLVIKGNNSVTVKNVLIGEVWVCSGQSNMEWALFKTIGGEEAIANSTNDLLRIFSVPHSTKMKPDSNINSKWTPADPKSTKYISAVGYYFLSKLQKELNVPVGFINVSYGGTMIEAWISKDVLDKLPYKDRTLDADSMKADYDAKYAKARPLIEAYQKAKDSAKLLKLPTPPLPAGIPGDYKGTTTIYNGEIAPLAPYAVKGIAWYQGESNAYPGKANIYGKLLPVMIDLWRKDWNRKDLPFIIIQLSGDKALQANPVENSGKAVVREAQLMTVLKTPNTALVTTSDCGELDVHYHQKRPVGERVCNAALSLVYGKPVEYTGPLYKSMKLEGNKAIIEFTHLGSGLTIKTDSARPASLYGFAIAGSDKKFYWANAIIENNKVVVSAPEVSTPVSVRYAWADFSFKWNLFNKEGHPASSFRTDEWELPSK